MRPNVSTLYAAIAAAAFVTVAGITLAPELFAAESGPTPAGAAEPSCPCPRTGAAMSEPQPGPAPRLDPRARLDDNDRLAALEALQLALTEVGDGSSYVWHARTGRVSGVVKPTQSFKSSGGRICRHIVVVLSAGTHSRKTEGVACRLDSGIWQLDG